MRFEWETGSLGSLYDPPFGFGDGDLSFFSEIHLAATQAVTESLFEYKFTFGFLVCTRHEIDNLGNEQATQIVQDLLLRAWASRVAALLPTTAP